MRKMQGAKNEAEGNPNVASNTAVCALCHIDIAHYL